MKQIANKTNKRIYAFVLAIALVVSSMTGSLIFQKAVRASEDTSNAVVINNFDETDVTYTNTEGWLSDAVTFSAKRDNNSELCADHAEIKEGVGVDGTRAAKFWQIRGASSAHDQGISYVRLYDTAENNYRYFTPEANTKYTISLKIKAVAAVKDIKVQLRSAATDGTITWNDTVVETLTSKEITASADADWETVSVTFETGDTVAPLYVSLVTHDGWWSAGNAEGEIKTEVYVDDIKIEKKVPAPSNEIINNFDETDVTYTENETWYSGAMSYDVTRDANSELGVHHGRIADGKGVGGSKAVQFWQIHASKTNDMEVSYVRLYDTAANDYRLFTPEANTKYTVSLKIKAVAAVKEIKVQLRSAAADGTIAYNDTVIEEFTSSNITASADAEWQELSVTFETGDTVAPLYVALTTHDQWWSAGNTSENYTTEVYVDDITITRKVYTPSDRITNNFDETDVVYTNTEGWITNAVTYSAKRDNNSELCADHAEIKEGVGVDGTKAAKFWQIRGASSAHDMNISYVRLYDTAEKDYHLFTPAANTKYTISLKIKAVAAVKDIKVQLRSAAEDGTIAWNDTVIASLTAEAITASTDADWETVSASFTTGDTTAPLYVSLVTHDGWWSAGNAGDEIKTEVYVDDIVVAKKVYTPSSKIVNNFDETDVTYTNTEDWITNAVAYTAKRDNNSELCADYASIEEGVGVDGTKAARFWQIRGSSGNDQIVSYIRLYDTAEEDYHVFIPEANTSYTISLKIKAVKAVKNIKVELRRATKDGTIAYKDIVVAGLTNSAIVASEDADWQELTASFTTGDTVTPLYLAFAGHDGWYAKESEVYVDDIVVEKVKAVTCYNYCANGRQDETLIVNYDAALGELPVPKMSGARFAGYYTDAQYTQAVDAEAFAKDTDEIWARWNFWGNVTEDIENEIDMRDLIRLRKLVAASQYTEAGDLVEDDVLDTADLSEMRKILFDTTITFSVFSDFHYKEGTFMTSIEDLSTIFKRAYDNKAEFVLHVGDFCNDYIGSPELMKAYLDNEYDFEVYGVYGNHELESENNSMQVVTPNLTNCSDTVVWGTEDGKIGDGSVGYYYFDKGSLRIVCTDTQYSYLEDTDVWVHNPTNSFGESGLYGGSIGPDQLKWLEDVLTDAANNGKRCIVLGHTTFNSDWDSPSPDAEAVAAIYAKVNAIKSGTVMISMNGHYHTNCMEVADNVLYFGVNTTRNGLWQKAGSKHYTDNQTFGFVSYDEEGNSVDSYDKALNTLAQGSNNWFFEEPLNAIVTISPYTGKIEISGMKSKWVYDVDPGVSDGKVMPEIYSSLISVGK